MNFELGKFYTHEGGRQIAVLAETETYRWGKMFLIEEADATGHAISCMENNKSVNVEKNGWIEISKKEWMRNFEESSCFECGEVFKDGDKFVPTEQGPIHIECYSKVTRERGSDVIQPVSIH
jgi:hypothetical protein